MKVFPTRLFSFEGHEADIDRRTISGGTAISGSEDVIVTDGGGRVFAEFSTAYLDDPTVAKAWRAISALLDGGATAIIVPFGDFRHQPTLGAIETTHSDGTPFDDASFYWQSDTKVTLAASADLRATTLKLDITELPSALVGGEWLTIVHTTYRERAYRIAEIVEQDKVSATVKIRPPLREATASGVEVDLQNARCVMRLDGEMRSPTSFGFADGSVRFVEHFPGEDGY